jgi:sulfur relay protein TusB/DsrH
MSCLHTIAKSPASNLLTSCSALLQKGDGLIFVEDGIYYCDQLQLEDLISRGISVYCLKDDLQARASCKGSLPDSALVDCKAYVDLCCTHDKVVNWF